MVSPGSENMATASTPGKQPAALDRRLLVDPGTLMRIKSLELRAKVVVEGFINGLHRSPFHGFSVEFSEYRQYSPGDDLRYLDWRLYARSDRYYVKRFEDETNLRCYLVVDVSRSMDYGSQEYTKADYARTAAATLAYFMMRQRDAVGLITFDEKIVDYLPPRYRPGHLHRLMMALQDAQATAKTGLVDALDQVARTVQKRGLVILISDLMAPLDQLETKLGYLTSRGHEVVLWRTLDPSELDLRLPKPALVQDVETGRRMYVDPELARQQYVERFQEHAAQIVRICSHSGIDLRNVTTDRPLEWMLFDYLSSRRMAIR